MISRETTEGPDTTVYHLVPQPTRCFRLLRSSEETLKHIYL